MGTEPRDYFHLTAKSHEERPWFSWSLGHVHRFLLVSAITRALLFHYKEHNLRCSWRVSFFSRLHGLHDASTRTYGAALGKVPKEAETYMCFEFMSSAAPGKGHIFEHESSAWSRVSVTSSYLVCSSSYLVRSTVTGEHQMWSIPRRIGSFLFHQNYVFWNVSYANMVWSHLQSMHWMSLV